MANDEFILAQDDTTPPSAQENREGLADFSTLDQTGPFIPPTSTAQRLSKNFHYALGDMSPGEDTLFVDAISGNEPYRREELTIRESMKLDNLKRQATMDYIITNDSDIASVTEFAELQSLINDPVVSDPRDFYEKKYGRTMVANTFATKDGLDTPPELPSKEVYDKMTAAEQYIANVQATTPVIESITKKWEETSTPQAVIDFGLNIFPFVSWYNRQNRVEGSTSSFLPGSNQSEQYQYLRGLPPAEARDQLQKAVDEISTISTLDAFLFAKGYLEYTSNEETLDNAFGVLDLLSPVTVARVRALASGVSGGASRKVFNTRIKNIVRATSNPQNGPNDTRILWAQSREKDVNLQNAIDIAQNSSMGNVSATSFRDLSSLLPSILDIDSITTYVKTKSNLNEQLRIANALKDRAKEFIQNAINDPISIQRLTDEAIRVGADEAAIKTIDENGSINGHILDVDSVFDKVTNTHHARILVGNRVGTRFNSEEFADAYAKKFYNLSEDAYSIVEDGGKYAIAMLRNIDETTPGVQRALASSAETTENTFMGRWLGYVRGSRAFFNKELAADRDTAVIGTSGYQEFLKQTMEPIYELGRVSKESYKNMQDFLLYKGTQVDPTDPTGTPGMWNKNLAEFEQEWSTRYGKLPTEQEALAYSAFRQNYDMDWFQRNVELYKSRVRKGYELHQFDLPGLPMDKPRVPARVVSEGIPYGELEPSGVLVLGPAGGTLRSTRSLNHKHLSDLMGTGEFKVLEVSREGEEMLLGAWQQLGIKNDSAFKYVVVPKSKSAPLPFRQLAYNPGGHAVNPHRFGVRQSRIRTLDLGEGQTRNFYRGDINWFTAKTAREARDAMSILEGARQLVVGGADDAALDSYFQTKKFPSTGEEFRKSLSTHGDPNQPFRYTEVGTNTVEAYGLQNSIPNLVYNLDELDGSEFSKFTGQRTHGLNGLENVGTATNPVFQTVKTPRVDPVSVIENSMQELLRAKYFEDLKIKAAQRAIVEFGDVMSFKDGRSFEKARENPISALVDAEPNYNAANKDKAAAFANYKRATLQLMGTKPKVQEFGEYLVDKIVAGVYDRVDPTFARRVEDWQLHNLEPLQFLRTVAFHTKLGLFNPVQLFVQATTLANVAAIEGPARGAMGLAAGVLMRTTGFKNDPDMIKTLAQKAAMTGWKEQDFIDMYEGLRRSKWYHVGREVNYLDDFGNFRPVRSKAGEYLNTSTFFFSEGERIGRTTAWASAFLNWRANNIGKPFDERAMQFVLKRANTLNANMTSAGNAVWQRGILSIPTQFYSWQARMTELFLGKELTGSERARLITTYAGLFGLPMAANLPLGFAWPIHEEINKAAIENGIESDPTIVGEVLMKGLPQVMLGVMTGTDPAVAERYGPSGIPLFKDIIRGEKPVLEYLQGASGTTLASFLQSSDPLLATMGNILSGDQDQLPILSEDLMNFARNVSTVNTLYKAMYAFNLTSKYKTRTGNILDDNVTEQEAFISALTGAEPQRITDLFLQRELDNDMRGFKTHVRRQAVRYLRLGYDAIADGKDEDGKAFLKRAKIEMENLTPQEKIRVMQDSYKGYESLLEKTRGTFFNDPERIKRWNNKPDRYKGKE